FNILNFISQPRSGWQVAAAPSGRGFRVTIAPAGRPGPRASGHAGKVEESFMDRPRCEDAIAAKDRPFTGKEYLESLRDGREVYVYGQRVADVTVHPAFRNAARSIARLYDALHDEKTRDVLTSPTDTGSGGFTHKFFRVAHSRDDVVAQRDAIAAW